jgi:S-adenosylmethionine:tRNA-ribosyltransferase-isomerase (queuine synthetase)
MEPFLKKKTDLIVSHASKIEDVRFGDIITFYNKNNEFIEDKTNIVCHRVIGIKKSSENIVLVEKCDNYLECTEVNKSNFIGKVKTVCKNNKTIDLSNRKWRILNKIFATTSRLAYFYNVKLRGRVNIEHKRGIHYKLESLILRLFA